MGSLIPKQDLFTVLVARLILYAHCIGFRLSFGDAWDRDNDGDHIQDSAHHDRLAIDLNLFTYDNVWLRETEDHVQLGIFWESLNEDCVWGGRWSDGNHYEMRR